MGGAALLGFTIIAEFLEDPFGDDDCDYSVPEMIHALEVELQDIFDSSEQDRAEVLDSWENLRGKLGLLQVKGKRYSGTGVEDDRTRCSFNDFFQFIPLPAFAL